MLFLGPMGSNKHFNKQLFLHQLDEGVEGVFGWDAWAMCFHMATVAFSSKVIGFQAVFHH